MNRQQKIAWFNLITIMITLATTAAVIIALTLSAGMPHALYGLGFGGIVVLTNVSPFVFRKRKKHSQEVIFDERDEQIYRKADKASDIASQALYLTVCMSVFIIVGLSGSVPVMVLPLMVCWAFLAGKLAESITLLIQYGRTAKGEKS